MYRHWFILVPKCGEENSRIVAKRDKKRIFSGKRRKLATGVVRIFWKAEMETIFRLDAYKSKRDGVPVNIEL